MIRKTHIVLSLLCLALLAASAPAQTLKIAVIDLKKVFEDYYKTKEASERIKEIGTGFEKEMQDMMNDYQKMVDEATKLRTASEDKTLSKDAQDEKRKILEIKVQDIKNMERKMREFEVTRRRQLEDQQVRTIGNIREEITKVVSDYSARGGYNLVFDKSGVSFNGTTTLLYASGVTDVTADVSRLLNATKPAAGAAPAGSATPSAPKP